MYNKCVIGIPAGEEKENRVEETFETIIAEDIPKLMTNATDPGSSDDTKQDKYKNINTYAYHIQTAKNQRQREHLERREKKINILHIMKHS